MTNWFYLFVSKITQIIDSFSSFSSVFSNTKTVKDYGKIIVLCFVRNSKPKCSLIETQQIPLIRLIRKTVGKPMITMMLHRAARWKRRSQNHRRQLGRQPPLANPSHVRRHQRPNGSRPFSWMMTATIPMMWQRVAAEVGESNRGDVHQNRTRSRMTVRVAMNRTRKRNTWC